MVQRIDSGAKDLSAFLNWLLSGTTLKELPGEGRSFQRRCQALWSYWALPPIIDQVHDVIYVDGIHLGRKAVVLIARSDEYVLGWYAARAEKASAWEALMSRIAPPLLVVTDGGSGFEKARKNIWPTTVVQRCTFHAFVNIRSATTTRPRLQASQELYALGKSLIRTKTAPEASEWLAAYIGVGSTVGGLPCPTHAHSRWGLGSHACSAGKPVALLTV